MRRGSTVVFRKSSRIPRAPAGELAHEKEEFASWKNREISGEYLRFQACAERGIDLNNKAGPNGPSQWPDPYPSYSFGRRRVCFTSRASADPKIHDWTYSHCRPVRTGIKGITGGLWHRKASAHRSRSALVIRPLGSVPRATAGLQCEIGRR